MQMSQLLIVQSLLLRDDMRSAKSGGAVVGVGLAISLNTAAMRGECQSHPAM
jgi:hypothetical protein